MMVGPSGSGKSTAWRVLLKALTRYEGNEHKTNINKTNINKTTTNTNIKLSNALYDKSQYVKQPYLPFLLAQRHLTLTNLLSERSQYFLSLSYLSIIEQEKLFFSRRVSSAIMISDNPSSK